ncbi:hypothetical protein ID850_01225 [Xenorhabdus sp. Flor]|uniref:Uncharacterized protein n=1 Tax=Xenorhabdus szentirmaii TaxID=290112 RepID=A0AAW3YQ25_9GAMM|nr:MULTISPECIES: hypothetical protein [unclassified Xenorhabdus]MBD2799131.1 hypothetical protein [Xenorhabdus sp. M]MBD2813409.1 hypothetical protein [Xenorhabdus sp. Flor]
MKKELTDFEKISGYLLVLEGQQAVIDDMLTAVGESQHSAFDAITDAKNALNLATEALKRQLAELDHIETQKSQMNAVLAKLDTIKESAIHSLDTSASRFEELAHTVPAEIGQNILATIEKTDIAGAVRQRTDAQMDTIAVQIGVMSQRSSNFVNAIEKAENALRSRYGQLKDNFWWLIGGAMLSVAIVTGVSAKFFFSESVDRNYSVIMSAYQKTVQLEEQLKVLESKMDKALNNAEKLKKK